jgi:hypothetical protein
MPYQDLACVLALLKEGEGCEGSSRPETLN